MLIPTSSMSTQEQLVWGDRLLDHLDTLRPGFREILLYKIRTDPNPEPVAVAALRGYYEIFGDGMYLDLANDP